MTRVVLITRGLALVGTLRRAPVHLTAWQALRGQHELRLARAREEVATSRNHIQQAWNVRALRARRVAR